ncbi:uncharacterized protein FIBRA_08947 [Fibroporia radiculosa]|uniref:Uncharacterized protein n=1 Tax=Fibroporia radiculosa TaxID=599839 RepID=J4I3K3_9APHY|nr:uncharacterized protein FIBRA_08947 [Fibroporia radiculosa]CCM06662.1 predicted protein [Fibroporia radiculosa]
MVNQVQGESPAPSHFPIPPSSQGGTLRSSHRVGSSSQSASASPVSSNANLYLGSGVIRRAVSPTSLAAAAATVSDAAGKVDLRYGALSMATSVDDVLDVIPGPYRDSLRVPLLELRKKQEKLVAVRLSVAQLDAHRRADTLPPHIAGMKLALPQVSAEWAKGEVYQAWADERQKAFRQDVQCTLREAWYEQRVLEMNYLETQLAMETVLPPIAKTIGELYDDLATRSKDAKWESVTVEGQTTPSGHAVQESRIAGWTPNPVIASEYKTLMAALGRICNAVITLELTKARRAAQIRQKKAVIKETADVEMGEASSSTAAMQAEVQRAVAASLEKMGYRKVGDDAKSLYKGKKKSARISTGGKPPKASGSGTQAAKATSAKQQATQKKKQAESSDRKGKGRARD